MPRFNEQRYEDHYKKRQNKPEIYCQELGRKPESFYLINKISITKDETKVLSKTSKSSSAGFFELPNQVEKSKQ